MVDLIFRYTCTLGAVIMTQNQKSNMCPSWYDYLALFKHFLLKKLFMKPFRGIAQTKSIIQRKSWKIQRKISNVSIFIFQACKSVHELLRGIGLHFWDPDASFDTHIAIYRCDMGQIVYASNMAFLAFLT